MESLRELLVYQLSVLHSAEQQLVTALPELAEAASSDRLRLALDDHWEVSQGQITRLAAIFDSLGERPTGKKCVAMAGLIAEACDILEKEGLPEVKDAALIGAAQQIEHYEMSAYGTARALAETLGLATIADQLQETLDEERDADTQLNNLAVSEINDNAFAASV